MSSKDRILVIEDAPEVRDMIAGYLQNHGYQVVAAACGFDGLALAASQAPSAVVLDIGLPDIDGLTVMAHLRAQHPRTGIILATARGDDFDRVTGLEAGADSYINKPLNLRVLLAQVRSLLRRCQWDEAGEAGSAQPGDFSLRVGRLRIDLLHRRIYDAHGQELTLTPGEFALLIGLIERRGKPVSRQTLMACMRIGQAEDDSVDLRTVDTLIARLRRKLDSGEDPQQLIQTVYGKGYLLVPEREA